MALNVSVVTPTDSGFLTVFPAHATRPVASNLNFAPGQTVPNLVMVPVGAGDTVKLYNNAGNVDLIADVAGYFSTG